MKKLQWGFDRVCSILIPGDEVEKDQLRSALEGHGVKHRLCFVKGDVNGRLEVPQELKWEADGSILLNITVDEKRPPRLAWFWIVKCEGDERTFVWWSLDSKEHPTVWA